MALSLIGGWSSIPLLAGLGMLNGALSALGGPSSSAITRQTVPALLLQQAISWRRISQNIALIIGSGVAGLLVVLVGSGWALAFDALTFAVAAWCFTRLSVPPLAAPAVQESLWRDVGAGFREVMRHTWLWLLILQALLYHLFYGGAQSVLGPIVVSDSLGRPAWGWALSAMMLGFVVGGLVTLRWRPRARTVRRHLLPRADRRVPVRHGLVGLAGRGARRRLAARLRAGDLQRRLGPLDPGAGGAGQAGPGLLLRHDRLVHRPAGGPGPHRADRRRWSATEPGWRSWAR